MSLACIPKKTLRIVIAQVLVGYFPGEKGAEVWQNHDTFPFVDDEDIFMPSDELEVCAVNQMFQKNPMNSLKLYERVEFPDLGVKREVIMWSNVTENKLTHDVFGGVTLLGMDEEYMSVEGNYSVRCDGIQRLLYQSSCTPGWGSHKLIYKGSREVGTLGVVITTAPKSASPRSRKMFKRFIKAVKGLVSKKK